MPSLLVIKSTLEVATRLVTVGRHVEKAGVGPLDGIPQQDEQLRIRGEPTNVVDRGLMVVECRHGPFPDRFMSVCAIEQTLIAIEVGNGFLVNQHVVARSCKVHRPAMKGHEVRLFQRTEVHLWVLLQRVAQCGRATSRGTDDQKVRNGHRKSQLQSQSRV